MGRKKTPLSKTNTLYKCEKNSIQARNSVNCAGRCILIYKGQTTLRQYKGDKITAQVEVINFTLEDSEREKLGVNVKDLAGFIIEINAIRTLQDFQLKQNNCAGLRSEPLRVFPTNYLTKG